MKIAVAVDENGKLFEGEFVNAPKVYVFEDNNKVGEASPKEILESSEVEVLVARKFGNLVVNSLVRGKLAKKLVVIDAQTAEEAVKKVIENKNKLEAGSEVVLL
jgi:predicted Fe-Mo cluster-binding NifX family protein